jgi:hypothetical protein
MAHDIELIPSDIIKYATSGIRAGVHAEGLTRGDDKATASAQVY